MRNHFFVLLALCAPSSALLAQSDNEEGRQLALKVEQILTKNCYRCHGKGGVNEGGFNYSLDRDRMVARRKVVPGNPARSKIIRRLTNSDDPMPPAEEKQRPTAEEIALIKKWIEQGAPDFAPVAAQHQRITPQQMLEYVHNDLKKSNQRDRPFVRYFTLTHLHNAKLSDDEMKSYRHGLSKLINSLSWGRRIVVPKPVDPAQSILRIDLRDYQWDAAVWSAIIEVNPYGIQFRDPLAQKCAELTKSKLPFVRADWFVAAASQPPLYHDILKLPKTDRELEKLLHVDVSKNIQQERIARAGFNGSGVSRNNRLIERHESGYGAYWKSYDFAGNSRQKNLFAHPLGPGSAPNHFEHDGGEIIFNLPNGLQAYVLVDSKGRRIDKGPTNIVSDPRRPDRAVQNGLSCMSCHARGIIQKQDQIRGHVQNNVGAFTKEDAATVLALYPSHAVMARHFVADAKRFQGAVAKTGAPLSATEPIVALALRFEAELDLDLVAAEAGITPAELLRVLERSPRLAKRMGILKAKGGTLQREVLVTVFPDLMNELELGKVLKTKSLAVTRLVSHARLLRHEGEAREAVKVCEEALKLDDRHVPAYLARASAHQDLGDLRKAIADFDRAIELQPGYAITYNNRALANLARGDVAGALDDLNAAIRLDPRYAVAIRNLGLLRQQQGQVEQAIKEFARALEIDPDYVSGYVSRAAAYYKTGRLNEALADYDKALHLDPESTIVLNNRGMTHLGRKDYPRAIADFSAVIKLKPKHAPAYYNRGYAHFLKGDDDRAIADLSEAIRWDAKLAKAYLMRGKAHQRKGNNAQARADFAQARRLDPETERNHGFHR